MTANEQVTAALVKIATEKMTTTETWQRPKTRPGCHLGTARTPSNMKIAVQFKLKINYHTTRMKIEAAR